MSLAESAATAVRAVASSTVTNQPGSVHEPWRDQMRGQRDLYTQLVISCVLGLGAFLSFCVCSFGRGRGRKVLIECRYYGLDGPSCMRREDDSAILRPSCRSCRIAFLVGYRCSIELRMSRSWSLRVWMLMW